MSADVGTYPGLAPAIADRVPRDAPGAQEIGFVLPERYNASAILLDNLAAGRGGRIAVTGPAGTRTYAELAADACRFGAGLISLGAGRGDRVLLFLDDTPAYPAALFGAIRAGLVPVLINTLTPADLLQYYLADSGASIAICDAAFAERFNPAALEGTRLERLIVVNGAPNAGVPVMAIPATPWLAGFPPALEAADTHRDDMAFWMYSSGSTGRPKGIVHLQHDMAYTHLSYGRHLLALTPDDICFSVPKIFFAYGLGNSVTFPFAVGAASVLLPGQPRPAGIFETVARYRPTVFFGLPTLYTALTKAPEAKAADLRSLRLSVSAAEVLSAEVFNAWKALSGLDIMEGLGSTEVLHIYLAKGETGVSWFEASPETSLRVLADIGATPDKALIDAGGGASRLVDALLAAGWTSVTVLDVSSNALDIARARLGVAAERVEWIVADVTRWQPARRYDIWHDRAVFHFLMEAADRAAYRDRLGAAIAAGGHAIIATFAPDGPERCSGLPIARYTAESLAAEIGPPFALVGQHRHVHVTPRGIAQSFQFSVLRRL